MDYKDPKRCDSAFKILDGLDGFICIHNHHVTYHCREEEHLNGRLVYIGNRVISIHNLTLELIDKTIQHIRHKEPDKELSFLVFLYSNFYKESYNKYLNNREAIVWAYVLGAKDGSRKNGDR